MVTMLDALQQRDGRLSEDNARNAQLVRNADELHNGEPFPIPLYGALSYLWDDPSVRAIWEEMYQLGISVRYVSCSDTLALSDRMTR